MAIAPATAAGAAGVARATTIRPEQFCLQIALVFILPALSVRRDRHTRRETQGTVKKPKHLVATCQHSTHRPQLASIQLTVLKVSSRRYTSTAVLPHLSLPKKMPLIIAARLQLFPLSKVTATARSQQKFRPRACSERINRR